MPDNDQTDQAVERVLTPAEQAKADAEAKLAADQEKAGDALVFLSGLRKGAFALEVAEALEAVTLAVREHHKGGTVTIKLDIKPMKGATDVVTIGDTVAVKKPQGERPASVRFTTSDGSLQVDPPNQFAAISREQLGGRK